MEYRGCVFIQERVLPERLIFEPGLTPFLFSCMAHDTHFEMNDMCSSSSIKELHLQMTRMNSLIATHNELVEVSAYTLIVLWVWSSVRYILNL